MIQLKSESELERMRVAGRHVGDILVWLRGLVEPGITTAEIDRAAHSQIEQRKLGSSFLGYGPRGAPPYPAVICTSVNEEIVHGIPGPRELKEGDVLKLDFGVIFEGFHGDSAVSIPVGTIDEKAQGLLDATRRALYAGIEQMREGNRLGDVSSAIQSVAEGEGYSVVRDFVGHGIGRSLHEPPQVPNFGPPGRGPRLRVGMVLALEPRVNLGEAGVEVLEDGWTATTIDDKLSSHFEHTVAVTSDGPEILTQVSGSH